MTMYYCIITSGKLLIAEVKSRFADPQKFLKDVEKIGFRNKNKVMCTVHPFDHYEVECTITAMSWQRISLNDRTQKCIQLKNRYNYRIK